MERIWKYTDDTPVRINERVLPDHHVRTYTLVIRTMNGVVDEALRNAIQARFEVVELTPTAETIFCKKI